LLLAGNSTETTSMALSPCWRLQQYRSYFFIHNIDRGKVGIILDADTTTHLESVNIEVDASGNVLKTWNMANIINAAMIAGGDDPSQFVLPNAERLVPSQRCSHTTGPMTL